MLAFGPDRLGHCCCLSDVARAQLCEARIPVELCLSSNVITQSVPGFPAHHFGALHREGTVPVALCTDDCGVFDTFLSREYAIAAGAFGLDEEQLTRLAEGAIEQTFAGEGVREGLRGVYRAFNS